MNSSLGEGGLISFPLLLLEGNAILPMTPKAACVLSCSDNGLLLAEARGQQITDLVLCHSHNRLFQA